MDAQGLVDRLHWLGHDSFRVDGPPIIYFDPVELRTGAGQALPPADLVLVSHEHGDHCSPPDVEMVSGADTVVVSSASSTAKLPGARAIAPGESVKVAGVEVEAVRAYNTNKFRSPGVPFHPREADHVGFVVTIEGARIYFAGDTDHIREMAEIECDVALLPVSGTYVMTAEEAADAARTLQPEIAIPMHYGGRIGSPSDGLRFSELYGGRVVLLEETP
jgi:L-ascorbate metabolism protein UlaG (beta-lactamase superfamily)